nr:hypothetical protein [Romeriopsis navalis]
MLRRTSGVNFDNQRASFFSFESQNVDKLHHCHECGSIKSRDIAAAQVIKTRGQRDRENACGVEEAGASVTVFSQLALKQEIFGAI